MTELLLNIYNILLQEYGYRNKWFGETPDEVIIGAFLVQNTNWLNVEKALAQLRTAGLLTLHAISQMSPEELIPHIRPAGFHNQKAPRLISIAKELSAILVAVPFMGTQVGETTLMKPIQTPSPLSPLNITQQSCIVEQDSDPAKTQTPNTPSPLSPLNITQQSCIVEQDSDPAKTQTPNTPSPLSPSSPLIIKNLLYDTPASLRTYLLSLKGLGPETVDCIMLYVFGHPFFVIDAYTIRIFSRLGLCTPKVKYHTLQTWFIDNLPADTQIYRDYHSLLIQLAKHACLKQPRCHLCPLKQFCEYATQISHKE